MANEKLARNSEYGQDAVSAYPPELTEKQTSITADIVRIVSVTMSTAEMDILCEMLGNGISMGYWNTTSKEMIAQEFIRAIESVR